MDPLFVGYACVGALFVFLALGVPVGVSLGITGIAGMYFGLSEAFAFGQLRTLPFSVAHNYGFAVLPLFVLMGIIAQRSGMTEKLFQATDLWLRGVRGGMYQVVIVGSAIFAAISGSTVVNSLVFTRIAFPEMLKGGYSRSLSIGAIAASGGFAAMIPPSITMVIYGIMTEQSIGRLFVAGIVPGLLSAVAYMAAIAVLVRVRPDLAPKIGERPQLAEKLRSLVWVWPFALIFLVVIGGLYAGLFPPSGAGAIGAAAALVVALVYRKGKAGGWLSESLRDAAAISCVLFVILIGGLFFSRMLIVLGVIPNIIGVLDQIDLTQMQFLIGIAVAIILLGSVLDTTSMLVVTIPFLFPLAMQTDVDPIWFGIFIVKLIEISVITPPVGLNLFAVMSAVDEDTHFGHIVGGVMPFLVIDIVLLFLLVAFPELATWLPDLMRK